MAALRPVAVIIGVGAGALIATILGFALWPVLAWIGVDNAPLAGLTWSVLIGLGVAGYFAGRIAPHTHRFHGAVSGLGLAGLVVIIALLGGSPATTTQILGLALLAVVLGSIGGTLAGRHPW